MPGADIEVVKDIPGYKLILKAVLKSQIQQLVEQLADHTGEESVILTASVSDGSLSHLGSESGKVFLEDHDDIKSQFLGFCLKRYHCKQKEKEKQQFTLLDTGEILRDVPPTQSRFGTGPRSRSTPGKTQSAQKHQSPLHSVSPVPSPSGVHSSALIKAPRAGTNVRHEPYSKNKPGKASSNIDQGGLGSVLESARQSVVSSFGSHTPKLNPDYVKMEAKGDDIETHSDDKSKLPSSIGESEDVSEADDNSSENKPSIKKVPSSRLARKSPLSEDCSSSSNEPTDMKFSESMPPGSFGLDSNVPKFSGVAGNTESTAGESDNIDVYQSETSNMDTYIKVEGARESEMDLAITGVELGSMAQSDNNWVPDVQDISSYGISASEGSGGFGQGDIASQISQGYGDYGTFPKINCGFNKMYVCIECGQSFSFPSALKVHHRIHAGIRPHVCSECGKTFTQKNNLHRHIRNIHQAKPASSEKELKDTDN